MGDSKKIITIKDIAELANVSIGTVDRAIHNRGRVATTTIQKIKKIIDEVGYKPNIFASRLSRAKYFTFAVLMPRKSQDNKYWESSVQGIDKAERELSHYHVKIRYFFYDRYSANHLQSVCNKIIKADIDGVLIAPVLYKQILELIDKLPAHIPYVLFNTNLPESAPLSFIGQDSFQSGYVCAKLMKFLVHKPGTIAVILTLPNDLHIRRRAEGFREYFKGKPDFIVKEYELFNFKNSSIASRLMKRIFTGNRDIKGIFVTNVSTHYLAEYIKQNVKNRKVFLIGYDLIDKNVRYLEEGVIDFLISQKPYRQGYEGIYTLYRHVVLHEPCKKNIMLPIDIITKENVRYYLGFSEPENE
ncbi:MAG: LacI family DNA-binding transcriptional regulator [Spirochaetales bacterium]|nr:LacI family DNA-binding transcriptional regulator [Spirochaetales bacterium]